MRRYYKITYSVLGARSTFVNDVILAENLAQALEFFKQERENDGVKIRYDESAIVNIQIIKP